MVPVRALPARPQRGNGIRPRPYSRNMEIQPFTYDCDQDQRLAQRRLARAAARPRPRLGGDAVGHDVGPVDKHGFNANLYGAWNTGGNNRSLQYVIDGLKMQGCGPGLVGRARRDHRRRDGRAAAGTSARSGPRSPAAASATARSRARRTATTTRRRSTRTRTASGNFQAPVARATGDQLRSRGQHVDLRFTHDGYRGLDVLAENQPYSRLVDCDTLQDREPGPDGDHAAAVPGQGDRRPGRRQPRRLHLPVADRGRAGPAPAARWWPRPTPAASTGRTTASPSADTARRSPPT